MTVDVAPRSVLFVCLGNICRSPVAHVLFARAVAAEGLSGRVSVDSCGTGDWHVGEGAHPPMVAAAARAGFDLRAHRARTLSPADFERFDLIVPMDRSNERDLRRRGGEGRAEIRTFLSFVPDAGFADVPDPWGGPEHGYDEVIRLVERGIGPILSAARGGRS